MFCCTSILLYILTPLIIIYLYYKWIFNHWKRQNVPYPHPKIPFGNFNNPLNRSRAMFEVVGDVYKEFKAKNQKHCGVYLFAKPIYLPIDTDILRNIFTVDFNHFTDRGIYVNEHSDPLSANLFGLGGQKWRNLRVKFTPTFTSGKMKLMYNVMEDSARNMIKFIDEKIQSNDVDLNVKDVMGNFTTDVIGSTAFGLNCNSFTDQNSAFRYFGKKIFSRTIKDRVRGIFAFVCPGVARKLGVPLFAADVQKFFIDLTRKNINYREQNNVHRNDFLQLLIELRKSEETHLTLDEIAAQCFVFFLAGFETSSTTMSFALYEMALNEEIQTQARQEIFDVLKKHNNEFSYDAIMDMKYLQQIVDETLRKYPALPIITRVVTETYKIPESGGVLDKGCSIFIPTYGVHHDPDHYKDPEVFDPERFNVDNKKLIKHYTYFPFGEGPRLCIGLRFGLLQSKIGLALLLMNFKVSKAATTKIPMEFDPFTFVITPKHDIYLRFNKV